MTVKTSRPSVPGHLAVYYRPKQACLDGLRHVVVHSRLKTPFAVFFHRMGSHGHDGCMPAAFRLFLSNEPRGLEAVHTRQLDIHQNEIGSLFPGHPDARLCIYSLQHRTLGKTEEYAHQFHVEGVVFYYKNRLLLSP